MDGELRRAWRFFFENAGFVVGQKAMGALALAKAERRGKAMGLHVRWEGDSDADLGDHALWCSGARLDAAREAGRPVQASRRDGCQGHDAEWCAVTAPDDRHDVLASLGGCLDMSCADRRVTEAELMVQALAELERREVARKVTTVTSSLTGVTFNVAVVQRGERYGVNHVLVNRGNALVEFYDARGAPGAEWDRAKRGRFTPLGQLVSRYNLGTLVEALGTHQQGLTLWGDVPDWRLDRQSFRLAVEAAANRV